MRRSVDDAAEVKQIAARSTYRFLHPECFALLCDNVTTVLDSEEACTGQKESPPLVPSNISSIP